MCENRKRNATWVFLLSLLPAPPPIIPPCFSHALSVFHFDPSSRSPSSYIPIHHPFYVPEKSRNKTNKQSRNQ